MLHSSSTFEVDSMLSLTPTRSFEMRATPDGSNCSYSTTSLKLLDHMAKEYRNQEQYYPQIPKL
jgi:hypothetical protein